MKVLIMGGTSGLGSALKPVLTEFCEVITAGRTNCDVRLDLNDSVDAMVLPNDIDVVIDTAAHFGGKTGKEILEAENLNVLGTLKLCHAAVQAKVSHFVFISSLSACQDDASPYYGIYSISKRHAEEVARFFCSANSLRLTILRPSQIYGAENGFRRHQPFIYTMLDKAKQSEDIQIYGTHDAWRNYIYIDDLTMIISRVIKSKIAGTFSCQHPSDVNYSQMGRAAFGACNTRGGICFLADKPDIPDNVYPKDNSLYEKIGFYPQTSIEEGFRRIAQYL